MLSSYAVEDRVQVADVDPSMVVEYIDDDLSDAQPCPICGDAENEELLLICDGCDVPTHTYCAGLDEVPAGAWYCSRCETQRPIGLSSDAVDRPSRAQNQRRHRTRAQQRRVQNRNQINSRDWARVWQSVWDHLNIDLDFPFDDDRAVERAIQQQRREEANQREFRSWQRRFEVAERQGGGSNRFRDTAALLDIEAPRPSRPRAPREPTPEPESLEEMRAWNAFERAREIENNPSAARKRKEPTLSPSPEPTEPARKLKRPRTRRAQDLALAVRNGESSRAGSAQASARANADNSSEPSFLQSLLKEVEDASTPQSSKSHAPVAQVSAEQSTSGPSSPSLSPASSSHSSPRLSSATPPPQLGNRPISPIQLTPPSGASSSFSPEVSPAGSQKESKEETPSRPRPRRVPRAAHIYRTARSNDNSPTRAGLSLNVKSEIQKLVGTALKPYYRSKIVSKEEYTDINRNISRKLYEQALGLESLESSTRARLEATAKEEVQTVVDALRQNRARVHGSSDDSSS